MPSYFRGTVLFLFLFFLVFGAHQRSAADLPLPNLLMQSENHLLEFTQEGVLVEETEIPRDDQTDSPARTVTTDEDGGVLVYNGTFAPSMSRRDPATRTWTHSKFGGWGTVNNVTYGGIASLGQYVYVTDMWTAYLGGPSGLVRFDRSGGATQRFLDGNEYRHVTVGIDGLLYALSPDEHTVHVISPATMTILRTATISENVGGVTADEEGTLYAAANYGRFLRCKPTGELIDALNAENASFYDIKIAPNGQILLSGSSECLYLSDTSFQSLRKVITPSGRFWICHCSFTTPLSPGDVSVSVSAAPTQVELGGQVNFTISFQNKTTAPLKNVRVMDTLPGGLAYLSASSSLGTCKEEGGNVVCSVPTLATGAQGTMTVRARAVAVGTLPNTIRVGGSFSDTTPADNSATAEIHVANLGAPTGLRATSVSKSQVRLNWTDRSATETGIEVQRREAGGAYAVLATLPANSALYNDSDVTTGTEYWYRVQAVNPYGKSASSNEVRGVAQDPVPAPPTDLRAVATSASQVNLKWEDESDNETGFKIERKLGNGAYAQIGTRGAGVTTFSNTGLAEGSTYSFRVRATNTHGDSPYSNASAATTLPRAPTNLTGTAGVLQVALSWRDVSSTETGYRIDRKYENAEFVSVGTVAANITSYVDNTARAGRAYVYQVRALLGTVVSDPSNFVSVGPPADTPGGKLQVSSKSLKFGTVARSRKANKAFTVRNVGKKALFATVGSPTLPYRVLSGGGSFQLRPGKSRTVRVEFAPTVAGSFPSSLPVASTSLTTRLVTVRLAGKGR